MKLEKNENAPTLSILHLPEFAQLGFRISVPNSDSNPMASDGEDDFGGDFAGGNPARRSGNKRSFGDLDDDEDDIFGSKKVQFLFCYR
ncbi:hypothetical protein BUALT_Bualt07G0023400 [Buddleja alternifolia]|uniref:Uncharacterized protein n=1 Tax=Buddleja alternifolia TaxID=168488 RepID=A0AAV6X8Q3_9LAMI|nr:hypothetical protein BUALT_Bualt07G0023400 [Buddleja alternifolia]